MPYYAPILAKYLEEERAERARKSDQFATLHELMTEYHEATKDADWYVIVWRCPHQHRFWLAQWLCVRWQYYKMMLGVK